MTAVALRSLTKGDPEELPAPGRSAHHAPGEECSEVAGGRIMPAQGPLFEDLDPCDGRIGDGGLEARTHDLNLGELGHVAS
jgi:hypothetical protein